MGKLSEAKNKVQEERKEVEKQLDILISLAKSQTEIFQQRIEASLKDGKISDDLTVPITKVLAKQLESRAVYKEGSGNIVTKVTDAFKQLFNGNGQIADAVGSIISTGIDAILGAGEGTEKIVETYYVVVEYPALIRYDISCWGRNMKATGYLTSILTNAISYTAYKSAVDVSKMDFNTFLAAYAGILNKAFGDNPKQMKEMIEEAKEIFNMFKDNKMKIDGGDDVQYVKSMPSVEHYTRHVEEKKAVIGDF